MRHGSHSAVYHFLSVLLVICSVLLAVQGALVALYLTDQKAMLARQQAEQLHEQQPVDADTAEEQVQWFKPIVDAIKNTVWPRVLTFSRDVTSTAPIIGPILALGIAVSGSTQKLLGPPWVRNVIRSCLVRLQRETFNDQSLNTDHHRLTIFKHTCWSWRIRNRPKKGRLVSWMRSECLTEMQKISFQLGCAQGNFEGIAGWGWVSRNLSLVEGLPDWGCATITDEERVAYRRKTYVSEAWLKKHPEDALARSFLWAPIEKNGKLWGVFVVDSRLEQFPDSNALKAKVETLCFVISKLLEKT